MTQLNPLPNETSTRPQNDATWQAILVGQSTIVSTFLFLIVGIYLAITTASWQPYAFSALAVALLICSFAGVTTIRRGNLYKGGWLLLIGHVTSSTLASFLFVLIGYVAVAYSLITAFFIIRYVLLKKEFQLWGSIFAVISVAISILAEIINPAWRLSSPLFLIIAPILTAILGAAFLIVATSQAWERSLRGKLVIAFLAVTIIPLVIVSFITYNSSRTALINDANLKLDTSAYQVATEIDSFIDLNLQNIRAASKYPVILDYLLMPPPERKGSPEESRITKLLSSMSRQDPVFISSVAVYDIDGITVADTYASDIGSNKSGRTYFKKTIETGLPYASDVEHSATSGVPSIYFAAPVRDAAGKMIGLIRIRYAASILQKIIIADTNLAGDASYAVLLTPEHVRLAHGVDRNRVYKSVVPLDPNLLKELQDKGLMPAGTSEELSTNLTDFDAGLHNLDVTPYFAADTNGDGGLEQSAVVRMTTKPWLVAFVQSQNVFLAPVSAQVNNNLLAAFIVAVIVGIAGFFFSQTLSGPLARLTQVAETIAGGDINIQAKVETKDEIGALADTFNRMTQQLRDLITTLEARVAARTRNLELAANVGRTVSQVRALDILLTEAAELIRQQFDLYYVQVYLVNPSQTYLDLQAGTGEVGKQLLARHHRLPLNTNSINGRAAMSKSSVVISDTASSPTFKSNPLLPYTRSEMAVPLMVGEKVVGVLDMQSEINGSLSTDILPAFEALAGQVAIAIQNANFLAETEQARAEVEAQARRLTRRNYIDYLDGIHKPEETGFVFEQNKIMPITQAEQTQAEKSDNALVQPISITGEVIGNLVVEMTGNSPITRTDELIDNVARQVAQQIEALRLLDSAERYRAEAEEASRRVTREGWQNYAETSSASLTYLYDLKEVRALDKDEENKVGENTFNQAIKIRDEVIGKLIVQGMDMEDKESLDLANAVAERLGSHIESLRLARQTEQALASTQRQAEREQALRQITSAVRSSTDPAVILRSAVRELGNILGRKTIVRMETSPLETPESNQNENDLLATKSPLQES